MQRPMPESRYFQLEQLAPGVFAAMINPGTGAWANAGIVDLGDRTLIFDTFSIPAAAADLRRAAVELTGRSPIAFVVNSHCHSDHMSGNQVFADAAIISTHRTRELILAQSGTPEEYKKAVAEGIRLRTERLQTESDPGKRRGFAYGLSEAQAVLEAADSIQTTPPTVTFTDQLVLNGSDRSAELFCYGGGHTESDAFLYLPADGILFAGDLVAVQFHPVIGHSANQWLTMLDQLQLLPIQRVVPGHGPLGTAADLTLMRTYISDMKHYVQDLMLRGISPGEFANLSVLPAYADWMAGNVFEWNLHFVHEQLAALQSPLHPSDHVEE